MLHIVHRDIKPGHILYSPTYSKHIFVDFGCTDVIKDPLGKTTYTYFQGTINFCTNELL